MYDSKMTVEVYQTVKVGNVTSVAWVKTIVDAPCRISRKSHQVVAESSGPTVDYEIRLYCDQSLSVPAGSRITVTDAHGNTRSYKLSSEAFNSYLTHQEIVLVREDKA